MTGREIAFGPDLPADLGDLVAAAIRTGNADAPVALAERLSALLGTRVIAIVHYGSSSADGESAPFDIDLLVLVEASAEGGLWGRAGGVDLDAYVAGIGQALAAVPAEWTHVADGRVLIDRTGDVASWLAGLRQWRAQEGGVRRASTLLRDRVWSRRMVERIRLADGDPVRRALLEATLFAAIPELHAQVHHAASTSIKHWLTTIQADDPALTALMARYGTASAGERADPLAAIVRHLYRDDADRPR